MPTLSNPGTTCQRYIVDLQLIYTDQVSEILDLMQKLQNKIKFQDLVYYIINTIIWFDKDEMNRSWFSIQQETLWYHLLDVDLLLETKIKT